MPKWVLNPEEEMLRGLKPAQVKAVRAIADGKTDLDAGEMARVAEGLRQEAKRIDAAAVEKAKVKRGCQKLISGTLFKHEVASRSHPLKGDVVRAKYPMAKHPEFYGTTNHKEKVDIKVGPLEA